MERLSEKVRALFDGKNFAVLSTLEPDGTIQSTVVWVKHEDGAILMALPKSRRKTANLARDPRATVVVISSDNPFDSAQVRGTATLEDADDRLAEELSQKYLGTPYPGFAGPDPQWVTARVRADKVTTSLPEP